ncbi:hypothetical protein A5692_11620 [Mycobacterium sp. E342]|uniref:hypothetical protein n=1 Tax=Mycobacterium sp. E342 TaxID=1834147 RepID=UPI0007FF09AA|nr:hypothetical protein [Mycobacterium sp. E342]OBH35399.1 hypothetical protein A5692_11620 [Mycobacterium sp. E342]
MAKHADKQAQLEHTVFVDDARSALLHDVGGDAYGAAVVCNPDGSTDLVLAWLPGLNNPEVPYAAGPAPAHEQPGPLPIEVLRRVVETTRRHRRVGGTQPEDKEEESPWAP